MIVLTAMAMAQPVMEEWTTPAEPHIFISSYPGMVVIDGWAEHLELDMASRSLRRVGRSLSEPMAMSLGPTWGDRRVYRALDGEGVAELRDIGDDSVILHGGTGPAVPDVDGDGLPDIHGKGAVHLQRGSDWVSTPYPPFESEWNYYRQLPVGDLTGDGRGDLLIADDTDWVPWWGFKMFQGGHLELYEGTDEGYSSTPAWTIDVDSPIADAFAVQLDGDPELELFMVGADDWFDDSPTPGGAALFTVDLSSGTPHAMRLYELLGYTYGSNPPSARPLGDLDGDGLDEVLLFSAEWRNVNMYASPIAHCLASTRGWDPAAPLWTLDVPVGLVAEPRMAHVADVNGDGDLDVVMVLRQWTPYQTLVQVWYPYGPPDGFEGPKDTGHTGDTGGAADTSADTGTSSTDTHGSGGSTADTGASPSPAPAAGEDPKGCGCSTSSEWAAPWSALTRRRTRRRP